MKYFALYLLFINLLSIIVCISDKKRAKKHKWRVPEKALFGLSIIGGSIGMYFTMILIRHKTKHKRFMIGIPLIIIVQCVVTVYLITKFV